MPRRKALHHHRPAVGPASRFLVVLPFAQPTAFNARCGFVRCSVSSPGTTGSVLWHRTTLEPDARSGSAAKATRCSSREPAFGTRATMACGGLTKSVRVRRRMGYPWPKFFDDPGPFKLPLFPARYTTSAGDVRRSCCLQVHAASAFSRAVQRNVDDSRGAAVISLLSRRPRARQFSGVLDSPPWITSGTFCVLEFEFTPWVAAGLFCVLVSAFPLWVVPGAFCVLRSSSFSVGYFRCFRILMSGVGVSIA